VTELVLPVTELVLPVTELVLPVTELVEVTVCRSGHFDRLNVRNSQYPELFHAMSNPNSN